MLLLSLSHSLHAYDLVDEIATVTTLFETTNIDHIDRYDVNNNIIHAPRPSNTDTPLASYNGNSYLIWLDANLRPQVTKITDGGNVHAYLEPSDYVVKFDGHHTFSLGIDKDGYIHIVGDMHNFNPAHTSYHTYLARFDNANIMYWVSTNPEDITSFDFRGDDVKLNGDPVLPGYGFSYCKFYNDRNGELYMVARTNLDDGYFPGVRAVGLYFYDTLSKTWEARGGYAQPSGFTPYYPCVLWEDNGHYNPDNSREEGYQGYMASLMFDMYNRMHFAATINNDGSSTGATDVVYAYSDDGGLTFYRADGALISPLPMRAEAGPSQADIVSQAPAGDHYWIFAGVYVNGDANPSVSYRQNVLGKTLVRTWDAESGVSGSWGDEYDSPVPASNTKVQHLMDPSGVMTYFSDMRWGEVNRSVDITQPSKGYVFHATQVCADQFALGRESIYRMINMPADRSKMSVVELEFRKTGSFTREVWTGITGGNLNSLSNSPKFPLSPDVSEIVSENLESVTNWGDNYASRLRGMLHVPTTGNYTFYIAGDNNCALWLSTDTTIEGASRIAEVKWWTPQYAWFTYGHQQSASIALEAGNRYYFEVLHKEAWGGDNVAVGWSGPGISGTQLIDAQYLSPWIAIPEGAFEGKHIDFANNLALSGTAILGANNSDNGTLGYPILHGGATSNINDGSLLTRSDTWNSTKDENGLYYDYVGVLWSSTADDVASVRIHLATFSDGGWFDYAGLGSTLTDADTISILPRVQYTMDGGVTWLEVTSIAMDYTDVINATSVPTVAGFSQAPVTLQFDTISGINGIRVFGDGAGPAGNNTAGFIGVYEFEVFKESL